MKKLLTILLALIMIMSLNSVVLAASQTGNPENPEQTMPADQQNTVNVVKTYKATNANTTSPAETVAFTFENVSVSDAAAGITKDTMPQLVNVELATYAEGAATTDGFTSNLVITLPVYTSVGVYTYKITETDGNMAGVTYGANATPIKLVVTVTQGTSGLLEIAAIHTESENETTKTDTFTNEYSAGSLAVQKSVTGNMGDKTKYFEITVTLVAPTGDTVGADIAISGGSNSENATSIVKGWTGTKSVTLKLKDTDTVTLSNIPYGVTYTVTEADYTSEGYDSAVGEVTDATEINSATASVTITNNKVGEVDTGISLDSIPYILLLVAVAAVVVVMVIRRRRIAE